MVYKEGGVHGSGDFCRLENSLCWHIPFKPAQFFVFSKPACWSRDNEVVEHVVSYLLSAYIQSFYRHSIQNRYMINQIPKMLPAMPYAHS